jgi:hypothetical protein
LETRRSLIDPKLNARRVADQLTQAVLAKAFRGELVPTEAELARRESRAANPPATCSPASAADRPKRTRTKPDPA